MVSRPARDVLERITDLVEPVSGGGPTGTDGCVDLVVRGAVLEDDEHVDAFTGHPFESG